LYAFPFFGTVFSYKGCAHAQMFKNPFAAFYIKAMKKAEQLKTTFTPTDVKNGTAQPAAPAGNGLQGLSLKNEDPSSTFRSSRYPVPGFNTRLGAAR
jgi:hypothetical protein